jgi:hypothetical protein
MRNLQKLIPIAIEAAIEKKIAIEDPNSKIKYVDSEFNGYISSLGGSIISSGLLPSMIFYSQKAGAQSDRPKVIEALEHILKKDFSDPNFNLLNRVRELYSEEVNQREINRLTQKVEEAMVALKLAIRIFEKKTKK